MSKNNLYTILTRSFYSSYNFISVQQCTNIGVYIQVKANLIIKLIEAHCSGQENYFKKALLDLVQDEELKGNSSLALSLKEVYKPPNNGVSNKITDVNVTGITTQSAQTMVAPRDRESLLELYEVSYPDVQIKDIVLPQKQKDILFQIIEEQMNAEILKKQGIAPSNRLLLCGPPGCGKTMTAMALATEIKLPLAYVRLDGLVSSYLGQTSTNLRKVFDSVRNQRIVLFLDEFDAIAKKRDDAHELGELKRVVTTLLQNFDNMPDNVFLIAATNHQHLLDPAIWRRFNNSLILELPEQEQRQLLLNKWFNDFNITGSIDIDLVSKITEGLNGSQIKELVSALAKYAVIYKDKKELQTEDAINIFVKQATLYTKDNSEEFWALVRRLRNRGIGVRVLERALGIPKSTLSYRLKEGENNE